MSNKRVAILAPCKRWGGIERKLLILCREFLALGVQPELLLPRGGVIPYPDEFPADVRVTDLNSGGKLSSITKLIRHLKTDPPAALLTAKDHSAKAAILASTFGRLDIPVYVKITNTPSQTLRRRFKRLSARALYPYANRLIALSEGVRDDLVSYMSVPADKIEVIYNPTVTPCIPERASQPVSHPWLQGDGPPVIMGAGRLTTQKDFATLISAFAQLRQERAARLMILGDGPLHQSLLQEAEALGVGEDVSLPGYIPDPIPYLARASLFALSSRYEGLGNVLIEALATGTPAVSTNCPSGPDEILMRGRIGPLVPVGNCGAMARAMAQTLEAPPSPELLREGLLRFRSDEVARRYVKVMGLAVQ